MGKTDFLKNLFVTVAGNFIDAQYAPENLERWITINKGTYSRSLTDDTTHVVVSQESWKRQGALGTFTKTKSHVIRYETLERPTLFMISYMTYSISMCSDL